MDKFATPTIFLTAEEDTDLYKICQAEGTTRTDFIYQAIIKAIREFKENEASKV